jgi:hypothetical protein
MFLAAEFGSVVCDGVPLADIPLELQESRVFKLSLRHNGLQRFPDARLSGSGMNYLSQTVRIRIFKICIF